MDDLELLDEPGARDALLALVAHVAFSDGQVQPDEFRYLQQLVPREDPHALLARITELARSPLDLEELAAVLPDRERRMRALRFAARMAWMDRQITSGETALLLEIANAFDLPRQAVEEVLAELVGRNGGAVPPERVAAALEGFVWEELAFSPGEATSGLARVVPPEAEPLGRLLLDGIEQIVLCRAGLAAGFREGDAWVPWSDVEVWTRVPVFGASVRIETKAGSRTLVDPRLRPVGALLDRIFGVT